MVLLVLTAACFGLFAQSALAGGGSYTVVGGTPREQATVHSALDASSFDWGLIPGTVTIEIGRFGGSSSTAGRISIDATLLDAGRFSWGVVQHEMGHQVDFFLLDDAKRQVLESALGGTDWCYSVSGLKHSDYGCERFASELAWAYWPSADNSMAPTAGNAEAGAMPAGQFRALLAKLLGVPSVAAAPLPVRAFAPALPKHTR